MWKTWADFATHLNTKRPLCLAVNLVASALFISPRSPVRYEYNAVLSFTIIYT